MTPPGTPDETAPVKHVVLSKLTWRLLPLLLLLYVVAYIDRINIGFAALQIKSLLGIGDAAYGLAAGIFFAGYVVFQLPSNLVLERVGARRWIATLMVAWGLISSCMIFAKAPWHFYALRFLLGSAEAGFFPGIIFYLKQWFPQSNRARTIALFSAAGPLSAIISGPLSGTLLLLHRAGLAGWQWMFLLEGVPAILLGLGVRFYLTNSPAEAAWLSPSEKTWLIKTLSHESEQQPSRPGISGVTDALLNRRNWMLVFVYFGLNCAGYGITFWLPSLIRNLSGIGTIAIGFVTVIPYAAALIVMVLAGAHSDKSGEHRWHIAVPALMGAIALLAAAYSKSLAALVPALSIAVVAEFSMVGPFWALCTQVKRQHAAAAIALINSIGNLGGLAGSYAVGLLTNNTYGTRNAMFVLAVALAAAGLVALMVHAEAGQTRAKDKVQLAGKHSRPTKQ